MRDVFIQAYGRSAARYAAVRQSLGEPDPFRLQHRSALREVVGAVIRERMDKKRATAHVAAWTREHVELPQRERFQEVAERELLSLHEGNFRALPGQTVRVRGVAEGLEQREGVAAYTEGQRAPHRRMGSAISRIRSF